MTRPLTAAELRVRRAGLHLCLPDLRELRREHPALLAHLVARMLTPLLVLQFRYDLSKGCATGRRLPTPQLVHSPHLLVSQPAPPSLGPHGHGARDHVRHHAHACTPLYSWQFLTKTPCCVRRMYCIVQASLAHASAAPRTSPVTPLATLPLAEGWPRHGPRDRGVQAPHVALLRHVRRLPADAS